MSLLDYLPERYHKSKEIADFENAISGESDKLLVAYEDFLQQLNPLTATWMLDQWESYYGLPVDITKPYDFRHSRLLSHMRGKGTVTKEKIKNVAESFYNGIVEVIEQNDKYAFKIKFTSTYGVPPNIDDLSDALDEIKPAHMVYEYIYSHYLIREIHNVMTIAQMEQTPINLFM